MINNIPIKYKLYNWCDYRKLDPNDYIDNYFNVVFHVFPLH